MQVIIVLMAGAVAFGAEAKLSKKELVAKGKAVYEANCLACHNADPKQDGALGPSVSGSSAALLKARLIDATYPAKYKPKRDTKVMQPGQFKALEADIPALAGYLGAKK